jgi:hypothetical protein
VDDGKFPPPHIDRSENSLIHIDRSEKSVIHIDGAARPTWMTEFSRVPTSSAPASRVVFFNSEANHQSRDFRTSLGTPHYPTFSRVRSL